MKEVHLCPVPGCGRVVHAGGWCQRHYNQVLRTGGILAERLPVSPWITAEQLADDLEAAEFHLGLARRAYEQASGWRARYAWAVRSHEAEIWLAELRRGKMAWIQTYSGRQVDLIRPRVADIVLVDIAHALANSCRFNGHCRTFYSVAQHAVEVAKYLREFNAAPEVQLWGLHHDDAEAYLGDMVQPLKHDPRMECFRRMEEGWMRLVARAFDLSWPEPVSVAFADRTLLATEARDLLGIQGDGWDLKVEPVKEAPRAMGPLESEGLFVEWHERLVGEIARGSGDNFNRDRM